MFFYYFSFVLIPLMKESEFIEKNKKKWQEVEKNLADSHVSPNEASRLFVQSTADLSYARTFYKSRSVKIYLNEIAKGLFNDINQTKSSRTKGFLKFWKTDLPLVLFEARRSMLISFLLFTFCFILGIVSSIYEPDFARTILSSGYIDMTNENIAKGDAMAVYKSSSEMQMFMPIFLNNIRIDFITFFSGLFMSVGTVIIMIVNGVMVGAFQFFFIQKGLFWESFLAIWTHGTIEISTIIISGGAGLTLGRGLLFPGTYPRLQALRTSALNGLKIIIAVFPLTLLAAFIESFLTRHTEIPDVIRFAFILLSLAFILFYFLWYPRQVAKNKANEGEAGDDAPVYKYEKAFNKTEIHTGLEIASFTFRVLFKNLKFYLALILIPAVLFALVVSLDSFNLLYASETESTWSFQFFDYVTYPVLAILSLFLASYVNVKSFERAAEYLDPEMKGKSKQQAIFTTVITVFITLLILNYLEEGFKLLICLVIPFLSLLVAVSVNRQLDIIRAFGAMRTLLKKQYNMLLLGMILFSFLICFTIMICLNLCFQTLGFENAIVWAFTGDSETAFKIRMGIYTFRMLVPFLFYYVILNIYSSIMFFSLKEINTAENIMDRIRNIKIVK